MAVKMLVLAVAAVLVAAVHGAFTSDGSSAAAACITSAGAKYGVTYLAGGTGAGQAFITAKKGPVAFGDEPFATGTLPTFVKQFPIAIGSIAVYSNTPTVLSLTPTQLCKFFSGALKTYTTISRADSSGSTAVFTNFLIKSCGTFVMKTTLTATGTSGMIAAINSTPNSLGYAVCGQAAKEVVVKGALCQVAKSAYPISYKLYAYTYAKDPMAADGVKLTNDIKAGACSANFFYPLPTTGRR